MHCRLKAGVGTAKRSNPRKEQLQFFDGCPQFKLNFTADSSFSVSRIQKSEKRCNRKGIKMELKGYNKINVLEAY